MSMPQPTSRRIWSSVGSNTSTSASFNPAPGSSSREMTGWWRGPARSRRGVLPPVATPQPVCLPGARCRPCASASSARPARVAARGAGGADRRDLDVLPHGEVFEQPDHLKGTRHAGAGNAIGLPGGDVRRADRDLTAGDAEQPGDHVDQRRLARSVRADQAEDLATGEGNADARRARAARQNPW